MIRRMRIIGLSMKFLPFIASLFPMRASRSLAAVVALVAFASPAAADLQLSPGRVVLDDQNRSAAVHLGSLKTKPSTFRIYFMGYLQQSNGATVEAKRPESEIAKSLIVYSPRSVELNPGESQTVRILYRRNPKVPPGEYRTYLTFAGEPDLPTNDTTSVQVAISSAIAIPVIVRVGDVSATATVANAKLERGKGGSQIATFDIKRSGNGSVYGDLTATMIDADGKTVEIGRRSGVAVFVENDHMPVELVLSPPPGVILAPGSVRIEYRTPEEQGGELLASAVVE